MEESILYSKGLNDMRKTYNLGYEKGKYYLAKFGGDLALKLKSEIQVKSGTPVTVTDAGIVISSNEEQ